MKKILITGAGSYIGTSFENYINENYPEAYSVDTLDMMDDAWREKDFSGYDAIFHVAGIAHRKETKENEKLYYAVNFNLAKDVAEKAKKDGARQFVFLSSMSVYGSNTGIIKKDTPTKPKSNYGKSKLMAESAISELQCESFSVTIVRPPMVYGLRCRGNFNSLVKIANKLPVFPRLKNCRSMIYIDNLSEFVRMVVEKQLCGIFMPQNKQYMSTYDMARWVFEAQGKKLRSSAVLGFFVKMLSPFVTMAKKAFGSLIYHNELEAFNFSYCVTDLEESVKKSIASEEISCEG